MKILMVYPEYPDSYWSFKHSLKFVFKKAAFPPLGLLTIAAILPKDWQKKVVDMNVSKLREDDLRWADYVFISAMVVQKASAKKVIKTAKSLGKKVVLGGPLFTTEPEQFEEADHLLLNEAEITLPLFLDDLSKGCAKKKYSADNRANITETPLPLWSLINLKNYSSMSLQYSRGCPFNCEFCDITFLDGREPRTKTRAQITMELESLYQAGWRGSLFIVDDNFIGNKNKLKSEILPVITAWQEGKNHPFSLFTEVSINLSDDEELMSKMVKAGFEKVFIGIETPDEAGLSECDKKQNMGRDLVSCVKKIQNSGLEVMAGFIVGFDSDEPSIFGKQINFIQKSGINSAMVGLLNAPRGTRLYNRLKEENRLHEDFSGDNTDASMNFDPKMDRKVLVAGYKKIVKTIYAPKNSYERMKVFLREYRPAKGKKLPSSSDFGAFCLSVFILGIMGGWKNKWYKWALFLTKEWDVRWYYWASLGYSVYKKKFAIGVKAVIFGEHFRITSNDI
jgi:radical SAM superfamily enzyme YgiQ (UPF0313 family)